MREYLLVMLTSGLTTYLLSGLCRQAALRWGAVAKVRSRDVHTVPIPYFGGVAMLGGVALACLLARNMPFLGRHLLVADDALTICLAGVVICAVGVVDDLLDLPALAKAGRSSRSSTTPTAQITTPARQIVNASSATRRWRPRKGILRASRHAKATPPSMATPPK